MNKSEQIRSLARAGQSVSDIASKLGISYQFAYNVCRKAGLVNSASNFQQRVVPTKPTLSVERLCAGGFSLSGALSHFDGGFTLPTLPKCPGVYAYVWAGHVQYIGVATRSLAQRLYWYSRPGASQRTNLRMNAVLNKKMSEGELIEIYCATPPDLSWNGFRISGAVGLEAGLISEFHLPLNIKGA